MPKPTNKRLIYPDLSIQFLASGTINAKIETLSELFTEWFLYDSTTANTLESFLVANELTELFSVEDFTDLICGTACLDDAVASLVLRLLPFHVSPERMKRINTDALFSGAEMLVSSPETIKKITERLPSSELIKKEYMRRYKREWNKANREYILAWVREYRKRPEVKERIKEQAKIYREAHREQIRERQKEYYQRPEVQERTKKRKKQYRIENRERFAEYRIKRRQNHPELYEREKEQARKFYYKNRRVILVQHCIKQQENRQNSRKAKTVCPTYLYLLQMRQDNRADYMKLFGYRNPVNFALKTCPALQEMDPTKCAFCTNAHDATTNCAMYNMVKLPDDAPSAIMEKVKLIKRKSRVRKYASEHAEQIATYQQQYRQEHHEELLSYEAEYREKNAEAVSARKKKCYHAKKEEYQAKHKAYYEQHREEIAAQQRAKREKEKVRDESAKSVCPTFLYLLQMRHDHRTDFVKLLGQRDLVGFAIKKCPALQEMDASKCAFCDGSENPHTVCEMQKMATMPDGIIETMPDFVAIIKAKRTTR